MYEYAVTIKGVRTYQIHVMAPSEEAAKAQANHMIVSGSVDFSHDLVGFNWEISMVERVDGD